MGDPRLTAFRAFRKDAIFSFVTDFIDNPPNGEDLTKNLCDMAERYMDSVAEMAEAAERFGIAGNVWQAWVAMLFVMCETPLALAHERRKKLSGSLMRLAQLDSNAIFSYFNYDLRKIDKELGTREFALFGDDYKPLSESGRAFDHDAGQIVSALVDDMRRAKNGAGLLKAVSKFYAERGVGIFALYKAFRWDGEKKEIVAITHTENIHLHSLIGYEEQKRQLVENTVAFLEDRPANNVLLYGESGTGKSSSVKALLNEYEPRGLRMIEIYKHQIGDLDLVIEAIKNRNYKFVIFMDDLSFEQFETEYKYLKAFIEGGLEKRPDNVLIYATSNRRHLMKETWGDRDDVREDMHESETQQEKMSLVDRFGLMISYYSPAQEEYLNIVRELAKEYGITASEEELEQGAIRWELRHGGFSGRSARQFVEFLAGK